MGQGRGGRVAEGIWSSHSCAVALLAPVTMGTAGPLEGLCRAECRLASALLWG